MSKVLVYSGPFAGHLFPVVPTLLELQARGHDVVGAVGPLPNGMPTATYLDDWLAEMGPQLSADEPLEGADGEKMSVDAAFARWGEPTARELEHLLGHERPDAVLIDPMLWGAMVVAEATGMQWGVIAHSCGMIPTDGPRVFGPGVAPPRGPIARLRHKLAALALQKDFDLRCLGIINELRHSRGLSPLAHAAQQSARQPLTLAYTAEPFEYPRRDWHRSVRFVGPGLWDAPSAAQPDWLRQLDDRPIVLVCTSSALQNDEALAGAALPALAETEHQVVATVPSGRVPGPLPPNARVSRYVPHQWLLPRAACVVCHGGFGITQKALAAGVPVVACPFGRDQFEVARRVEVAGAGVRLVPWELTPERVRNAVDVAIRCRPGAERIAEAFRRAGGPAAAADAIEEILPAPASHVRVA